MEGRLWSIRLCVALLASLPLGCASGGAKSAVAQPPVPPAQPEVQKADPALAVIAQAEAHLKAGLAAADEGEMDAARKAAFERLDTNRNATLDEDEFAARNPSGGGDPIVPPGLESRRARDPRFVQLDRNGDGRVTLDEYLADGHARFARADSNRDGRLSRAEFDALDQ